MPISRVHELVYQQIVIFYQAIKPSRNGCGGLESRGIKFGPLVLSQIGIEKCGLFDMLYSHFPLSEGADQMSWRLTQSENFKVQLFYDALRGSTSKVSLEEYLDC